MVFLLSLLFFTFIIQHTHSHSSCATLNCKFLSNYSTIARSSVQNVINQKECLEPFCSCINNDYLFCTNFTRFSQLKFAYTNNRLFRRVELRPRYQLELNKELQLANLNLKGRLNLYNLKSIDLKYNPFKKLRYPRIQLGLIDSKLDYKEKCKQMNGLDSTFANLRLDLFRLDNVNFSKPLCPYMFQNSTIEQFVITNPNGKSVLY